MSEAISALDEVTAAPPVVAALSTGVDVRPFAAEFRSLGVFPPRGAPRVLWLGVGEGLHEIVDVQREVAVRLHGLGARLDRRPFHPHLTLARWRVSQSVDRDRVLAAEAGGAVARTRVDHVTLYYSRLTSAGPAYAALTRANLT